MVPFHEALRDGRRGQRHDVRDPDRPRAGASARAPTPAATAGSPPNIEGLTLTQHRQQGHVVARRPRSRHATHAPTRHLRHQRRGDRRRHVPHARRRHPARGRVSLLPCRGHQQRADRHRARAELPAAEGDRIVPCLRDHVVGPRRRLPTRPPRSVSSHGSCPTRSS